MKQTILKFSAIAMLLCAFAVPGIANAVDLPIKDGTFEYVSPEQVDGATTIDTVKAHELWENRAAFVDTRKDTDFEAGRIPGAVQLAFSPKKGVDGQPFTAAALEGVVSKSDPLVCYCNGSDCDRSSWCAALAHEWGWTDVYYYRDGYPAWVAAGYPTE